MFTHIKHFYYWLMSPALPGQIFTLGSTIATVAGTIVIAIGFVIWNLIGAWKVLLFLMGVHN